MEEQAAGSSTMEAQTGDVATEERALMRKLLSSKNSWVKSLTIFKRAVG
jgi:hypothetical protein